MDLRSIIKTKEERLAQQQRYFEKMFPFGNDHKEKIEKMVKHLAGKSEGDSMLFFFYIVAKEKYMEQTDDITFKESVKALKKIKPQLDADRLKKIIALIVLDTRLESLTDLPNFNSVDAFAKTLSL